MLPAVVNGVTDTNHITDSLVPLGAVSRMPDAFHHKAFAAGRAGKTIGICTDY